MPTVKPRNEIGFGLLGMTWRPKVIPDEQAFPAMKAAIANGATIWSTSPAYGMPPEPPTAGLLLLRRYFENYPDDAEKVTLFIRGCIDSQTITPVGDRAGVRASAEESIKALGGAKKIDIFGPARIDRKIPLEETIGAVKELVDDGLVGAIGLSEVGAPTIRKAHAICPLSVVEVEFSLWSPDILTNGVAATCKELDIPILTYAPLGYGFLTGQVTKLDDIPKGDIRHMLDRFQPQNFSKNLELLDKINEFAQRSGLSSAQLALAWIRAHSNTGNCGTIIPIPGATAASRVEENSRVHLLPEEEKKQLDAILDSFTVVGDRQIGGMNSGLWG
ncbi:MAG: hypothetical protein Q9168_007429 [Polycauliona sp. 1 TL-2023]